ncbi:hypothetical protein K458DRAFT_417291 [Lentithecium fluviatile CBS 122367]|uniref:Uncharacterized protein n=1 Tax=Lentithecium fluviatile CBS 122367 TaxID=1168545 RepID=A0A6G1J4S7_9PLEO|nr:hypothetical protein K458DRAFT_417291 [Lentithecium fluviatile CBS 122367]
MPFHALPATPTHRSILPPTRPELPAQPNDALPPAGETQPPHIPECNTEKALAHGFESPGEAGRAGALPQGAVRAQTSPSWPLLCHLASIQPIL